MHGCLFMHTDKLVVWGAQFCNFFRIPCSPLTQPTHPHSYPHWNTILHSEMKNFSNTHTVNVTMSSKQRTKIWFLVPMHQESDFWCPWMIPIMYTALHNRFHCCSLHHKIKGAWHQGISSTRGYFWSNKRFLHIPDVISWQLFISYRKWCHLREKNYFANGAGSGSTGFK